jgi:hypothetical protein
MSLTRLPDFLSPLLPFLRSDKTSNQRPADGVSRAQSATASRRIQRRVSTYPEINLSGLSVKYKTRTNLFCALPRLERSCTFKMFEELGSTATCSSRPSGPQAFISPACSCAFSHLKSAGKTRRSHARLPPHRKDNETCESVRQNSDGERA